MKVTLTTFPNSRQTGLAAPEQGGSLRIATRDIGEGIRGWELWSLLGWQDIRHRYRRSLIGPFWLTISMALLVGGLGFLYAGLFKQDISVYLPYLSVGLILWSLIATQVTESCTALIGAESIIKQMPVSYSMHLYRVAWRNLIILAHNAVIYVAIAFLFDLPVGPGSLLAVPGLVLLTVNLLWIGLVLGVICARFRDVPQIVTNAVQLIFFLSPILWQAELLPDRAFFVDANPVYHLIEVVRAPLLGQPVPPLSWIVVTGMALTGWLFTLVVFGRYRRRLAYWL
jgi:ABC-type polysaccharide/polyol phosphate export permease